MGGRNKRRKRSGDPSKRRNGRGDFSDNEATAEVEDIWAQCELCNKWRRLPPGSVVQEDEPWFCSMNMDRQRNRCEVPEEAYSDDESGYETRTGRPGPSVGNGSSSRGQPAEAQRAAYHTSRGSRRRPEPSSPSDGRLPRPLSPASRAPLSVGRLRCNA
uniref:CW-type domain-containing protein n=1 Tax=Tetraselmis sp. GSL018 TaxID=582737 RepID=A0A061QW72_9CHLO